MEENEVKKDPLEAVELSRDHPEWQKKTSEVLDQGVVPKPTSGEEYRYSSEEYVKDLEDAIAFAKKHHLLDEVPTFKLKEYLESGKKKGENADDVFERYAEENPDFVKFMSDFYDNSNNGRALDDYLADNSQYMDLSDRVPDREILKKMLDRII